MFAVQLTFACSSCKDENYRSHPTDGYMMFAYMVSSMTELPPRLKVSLTMGIFKSTAVTMLKLMPFAASRRFTIGRA
jgi:hypothetical protein